MELVSLALLAGASLGVMAKIKYSKKEEGFQEADPIDKNVKKYFPAEHVQFVKDTITKFNPLSATLNPSNHIIKDSSGNTVFAPDNESIQNTLKPYITKVVNGGSYTYDNELSDRAVANYRVDTKQDSRSHSIRSAIQRCENTNISMKNGLVDCSVFKGPTSGDFFTKNCGVCHKDTVQSNNKKATNGIAPLYSGTIFKDLENEDNEDGATMPLQPRYNSFEPAIGTCPPDMYSMSKATCEKINKRIQCERAQSSAFEQNLEGCYECNDSKNKFYYVEDGKTALRQPTTIILTGNGECELSIGSGSAKRWYAPVSTGTLSVPSKTKKTFVLNSTGQTIAIPLDDKGEAADGSLININVKTQGDEVPSLSGKVVGYVNKPSGSKGSYTNDIREDDISQFAMDTSTSKPSVPFISVGTGLSVIQPHFTDGDQGTLLSLSVYVPFTYIATDQVESTFCQGPYIRNKQNYMNISQNPCFSSTSKAGNYNKACLQGLFIASGCTAKGSGYPDTNEKVAALNKEGTLTNITTYLRNRYTRAFSGKDQATGEKLSIQGWQEDIQFCRDKSEVITNYCDVLTDKQKERGPVSAECINYIYRDGDVGPGPRTQKPYGTYDRNYFGGAKSLYESGFKDRYCTPHGTMSPYDEKGVMRPDIIKEIQGKGGIESIKQFYRNIHSKANQGGLTNSQRAVAVKQCYGNDLGGPKTVDVSRAQLVDRSKAGNLLDATITDRKVKKIRIYASTSFVMISQLVVKDTTGKNVAYGSPTKANSTAMFNYPYIFYPSYAVNGSLTNQPYVSTYASGYYYCSAGQGANEWWEVDLQSSYDISEIVYYSPERTTSGFNPKDMKMILYNSAGQIVNTKIFSAEAIQKFGNFGSTGPDAIDPSIANKGSKVRISGPMAFLVISQLVVKDKLGNNVALKKPTSSSSVATFIPGMPYASSLAVDGNASNKVFFPTFPMGTYFCSSGQGANEWWEVDLQGSYDISQIVYYNCGLNCGNNPSGMKLEISNTEGKVIYTNTFTSDLVQTFDVVPLVAVTPTPLAPSAQIKGAKIRVLASSTNYVMISQLIVFDKRGNNVALRKPTSSRSHLTVIPGSGFISAYAVDGDARNRAYIGYAQYYCSGAAGAQEWWEVDLQGSFDIDTILYFSPDRVTSGFNPKDMKFKIYDSAGTVVKESTTNSDIIQSFDISPPTPIPDTLKTAPKAKKIRIYGTAGGLIQISQLVVKDTTGQNIAFGKSASSSSARDKYDASYAVGGNVKVKTPSDNMFISGTPGVNEWWEVDLGDTYSITQIIYYNCGGGCINYSGGMTLKLLSDCDKEITTRTFGPEIIQYFNFV